MAKHTYYYTYDTGHRSSACPSGVLLLKALLCAVEILPFQVARMSAQKNTVHTVELSFAVRALPPSA